jgi:S1-C subfamily serine protease
MSPHAINLRSDSPALLVEFNLPPGTHARIGASPAAEISLPLAGLADFAGMIGRTPEGSIYHADPDGGNLHHIQLPGALALPPYQFVVFHPAPPIEVLQAKTTLLQPGRKKLTRKKIFAFSAAALVGVITAALVALAIIDRGAEPTAAISQAAPKGAAVSAPETASTQDDGPLSPQKDKTVAPLVNVVPPPEPLVQDSIATAPKETPSPTAKFDLETLAQRVAPAVFRLEVKDAAGIITGTGTAFAISADGLAVTNFHVVEGGESFTARTTQGAEFAISGISATDPAADLALVTLKASNLPFLELGESDSLNIGAPVAVFGAPRGLSGSMSDGILSARRTELEVEGTAMPNGGRVLQITAPISAGSSGSPVIDITGKVIGVAAAGFVAANAQNLNFVIPVEPVKKLRQDFSSGLASAIRQLIPKKEASLPKAKSDPDEAFYKDPDFIALNRHFQSDNWIEMLEVARPMAAKHFGSPFAHYHHALCLHFLGLNEQAEVASKRGLALDPNNSGLWQILASSQDTQRKTGEARENWKKAAALSPSNAITWQQLASSFLREGEFYSAISPLENLRKLDRREFEELLAACRAVRVHPPALRSMLHHFANLDETDGSNATAEATTDPQKLAASLVAGFLRHGVVSDIQAELGDYAPTVNPYFDQGAQQRPAILKDITTYRADWPLRSLRLVEIETARRDDIDTLEATYRLRYSASNGKTSRSGTLRQGIRYTRSEGRWYVSGIQTIERVPESQVPTKER